MTTQKQLRRRLAPFLMTFLVTSFDSLSTGQTEVERPLDIGPEVIRRAVRQVEMERRGLTVEAIRRGPITAHVAQVRVYTIDTRDRESCETFAEQLASLKRARSKEDDPSRLCDDSPDGPIKTVAIMDHVDSIEFRTKLDAKLLSTEKNLLTDTRNLALGMGVMMGMLWFMPESVTNWDKAKIRSNPGGLLGQWNENRRKGPVMDNDSPWINYLGHPLSGAATYTMARHSGHSPIESFGYSIAMSTFFWEYGVEAFAEIPSIQDLIITPVIGSLMGEVFFGLENRIHENGDQVLGSRHLGKMALVFLSPANAFSNAVNSAIGRTLLKNGSTDITLRRYNSAFGQQVNMVSVQMNFEFHGL